jgi:hypothetical protein
VEQHHEGGTGRTVDEIDVDEILAAGRIPAFAPEGDLRLADADGRVDRLQVAARAATTARGSRACLEQPAARQ